ncbi:DUF4832 domain-containing protein [Photobacterium damselae]|nr:DUF4832 domain-containing protein [Photobacterium damselae subsp. damselae]
MNITMPIKKLITSSILLIILTGCHNNTSSQDNPNIPTENDQIITPKINNNILVNPDIGFTDFSSIDIRNDPYSAEPSYPETSIVYFRWYWEQLEPQEGQYNFTLIDNVLNEAKKHNKKLVFRIMTLAEPEERYYGDPIFGNKKILGVPCWLKTRLNSTNSAGQNEGCSSNSDFIPDYNQPLFQNKISQLMQALGKQYDGNDNILRIDVGIIGTWGEWHMAGRTLHTPNQPDMITQGYTNTELYYYVDLVEKTFPSTTKIMLIGSEHEDFLSYSTLKGFGWRADCLGDWDTGWNHMEDGYPNAIEHAKGEGYIPNVNPDKQFDLRWQNAPIDFEICNTMKDWSKQPNLYSYDKVKETFNYALEKHASLINAKSKEIPEMYQDIVKDTLKKLGYRFELMQLTLPKVVHNGESIKLKSLWKNTGVAPSYKKYTLNWRLRSISTGKTTEFNTQTDIRLWLPAANIEDEAPIYEVNNNILLPNDLLQGTYYVDVALVNPKNNKPQILLGIDGAMKDRWHEITTIQVK